MFLPFLHIEKRSIHRIQKLMKNTKSIKLIFIFVEIFDSCIANTKNAKHFYLFFVFALIFEMLQNPSQKIRFFPLKKLNFNYLSRFFPN
jgi:hypothetical protein